MFEWTPEIGHDGSILYSRWDYIDRDNMPYMSLWAINPDGANARIVYGNYTPAPHCTFEPRPVPGSHRIVFTASAHHAQTKGSLVLLEPRAGTEGDAPLTRLTPEVPFPEIEGWPETYYANPWPLTERFHLVAWGAEGARVPGPPGWDRWHAVTRPDDAGKCVLGTVPVEADGSAHFRVPAGVIVFFQALDDRGVAVQTMRSVTRVQPGQTLGCIGCHEHREQAPPVQPVRAALREPSRLTPGPDGSWPLRFDRLVQPVLDAHCVPCHHPGGTDALAAQLDLTPANAYTSLVQFGTPSLHDQVWAAYRRGSSLPGDGIAERSVLWALLDGAPGQRVRFML